MNNRAHGIMYHYFHDKDKHIVGQGSISAEKFDDMLEYYGKEHNILSAEEFLAKSLKNNLSFKDVCLTFDDGLLCQYDVACPVMKDRGLTAFWFVYTSPLDGVMEKLEIYRHFRFSQFVNIEEFYASFFEIVKNMDEKSINILKSCNMDEYLKEFPFYTYHDKCFRYLRDVVLGEEKYNAIMDKMIEECHYDIGKNSKLLWLKAENIKSLRQQGHIIGLHSYSHPTVMTKMGCEGQKKEYGVNKKQLEEVVGEKIVSVAYPSDSYDMETIKCMREFGIVIGFKANMTDVYLGDLQLEYPREDHTNIMKRMERKR